MRCWKCGRELIGGTSVCVYCGAAQSRPRPVTQAGRAMRSLYDRYGAQTVLTNGAYLTSGLSDLVGDSKKLRNQLKMAMDAGIGRLYLEQLSYGAPNADFDRRVKHMLTEDAGLNDKTAAELADYFDEMIGWRVPSQPGTPAHTPPIYTPPRDTEEWFPAPDGNGDDGCDDQPRSEIDRSAVNEPEKEQSFKRNKFYPYEWPIFGFLLYFILSAILPEKLLYGDSGPSPSVYSFRKMMLVGLSLISLLMSFFLKKEDLKPIGSNTITTVVTISMFFSLSMAFVPLIDGGTSDFAFGAFGIIHGLLFIQMVRHRILEWNLLV